MTFTDDAVIETKRPRLDSTVKTEDKDDAKDEVPEVQKVPRAKKIQPNLPHTPMDALSVVADAALTTSNTIQPNNPFQILLQILWMKLIAHMKKIMKKCQL